MAFDGGMREHAAGESTVDDEEIRDGSPFRDLAGVLQPR
jgi:hypothetical protein